METNKIPTAKEMLHRVELLWLEESVEEDVLNFTLEFAKMHVKKALKDVFTEFSTNENGEVSEDYFTNHLKSITDSYSLENIK